MTISEIASATAARTAAGVQLGIGKALGNERMIAEGTARRMKADADYARALECDRYLRALSSSNSETVL
jgi:hypothetical protein